MLEKQYDPKLTEQSARQAWPEEQYKPTGTGPAYCIMLPPPNVTGTLHMGHGFQHTLMDALIRYHRMLGDCTLWQPGTDHAGIATQMVVEKKLAEVGLNRKELGRAAFEEKVWQWKEESGSTILQQMKKLGASCDWSRTRFTMDQELSKAVTVAFVKLYRDDLIYRGMRLVNWDPVLQTALSDLEVFHTEEPGYLYHIRYPLLNADGYVVIATTRPETMFGDVAVAVHPDDVRYQHLIGQQIRQPLTERTIPIIADDSIAMDFGTACVKITPAHDFNDFAMGKRHDLPSITIFTAEGKLNQQVPINFQGLSREAARSLVIETLTAQGFIEKIEPHVLQVPRSERSQAIVEPYLSEQWYLKMESLAKPALAVVEEGVIEFVPDHWRNTYRHWLTNIQDWCLSRQLWWGHRIPAWYDDEGNIYVAHDEAEAQAQAGAGVLLRQETDVLDTWFSAGLWPFSTLGWPEATPEFEAFYPTNVLVTGFDIIFFWVARMIMFGLYFTKQIPFKQVLITGLIRDHEGQKMSKSKGNVIDPIDLIDGIDLEGLVAKRMTGLLLNTQKQIEQATRKQYPDGIPAFGEDAVRFTYCALATHGRDVRFDLARTEGYRNFCNKLWNATRFIEMQLEKCSVTHVPAGMPEIASCDWPEQWLMAKLNKLIMACHKHFTEFRFDLLAQCLYEFTWYEFCDWYIEFAKIRLHEQADPRIIQVLLNALDTLLRLLHPLIPFITEDLWRKMIKPVLCLSESALMTCAYPTAELSTTPAESVIDQLKEIVLGARQIRSHYHVGKAILPYLVVQASSEQMAQDLIQCIDNRSALDLIKVLTKVADVRLATSEQAFDHTYGRSRAQAGFIVFMPLAGIVDFAAEREKTVKEISKLEDELAQLEKRLAQPKAPEEVLEKWRTRRMDIMGILVELKKRICHPAE